MTIDTICPNQSCKAVDSFALKVMPNIPTNLGVIVSPYLIQCTSCGTIVGVVDNHLRTEVGSLHSKLKVIEAKVDKIKKQ